MHDQISLLKGNSISLITVLDEFTKAMRELTSNRLIFKKDVSRLWPLEKSFVCVSLLTKTRRTRE